MNYVLESLVASLPPKLYIPQVAAFLQEKQGTVYQKIRTGLLGITVRQEPNSGRLFILLVDLVRYLEDGLPQPQPALDHRNPRNPKGINGLAKDGKKSGGKKYSVNANSKKSPPRNRRKIVELAKRGAA